MSSEGGVSAVSNTKVLVLDSLSPVGCKVEPPWIGLPPACLIKWHLGTVEGQPLELGAVTLSETFLGWAL